jgi:phosphatidylinositol 3-kinase
LHWGTRIAVEGKLATDCFATAQLFADGKPLCPAILSSFGSFGSLTTNGQYRYDFSCLSNLENSHFGSRKIKILIFLCSSAFSWNQKLRFPVQYSILPLKTQLVITLWTTDAPAHRVPIGGTTMSLFGRNRTLRMGRQKLYLWEGMEGDGNPGTRTPGKVKAESDIDRLEKLIKKYDRGQIERVPWLDRLTFQAIEKINAQTSSDFSHGHCFLFIELPDFEHPVVFYQKEAQHQKSVAEVSKHQVLTIFDPEASLENNPVEDKHIAIMRATKRRPGLGSEKDLKPNVDERAKLMNILSYAPTQHLSEDEKEMVWKFRYFLTNNRRALTKFVKSVDWSRGYDQAEAYSLLERVRSRRNAQIIDRTLTDFFFLFLCAFSGSPST